MNLIGDFVGEYTVRWVAGGNPVLSQPEGETYMKFFLGTGQQGDAAPYMSSSFTTLVGFTVIEFSPSGETVVLTSDDEGSFEQFALAYDNGSLLGFGKTASGKAVRVELSLYQTTSLGGSTFKALYGVTAEGDPDDVAVWTGDNIGP